MHTPTVSDEVNIVNCTEGDVRLVDGPSANKGRLEVCIRQSWASVCNRLFGDKESQVVCGQLGYKRHGILIFLHVQKYDDGNSCAAI